MAKSSAKNTPASNVKPQTGLALALQASTALGVDVSLTKDDIIAVAVSREEMSLKRQEAELTNGIRALTKDLDKASNDLNAALKEVAQSKQSQIDAIVAGFAKLGCDVKAGSSAMLNDTKVDITIIFNGHSGERNGGAMTFHVGGDIPKGIAAIKEKMKSINEEIAALKEKVVKVRMALNDLPTMERQARAAITEAALSSDARGQALLETLNGVRPVRTIN